MNVRTLNELFFRAVLEYDKPDAFLVRAGGRYRPVAHREALQAVEEVSLGLVGLGVEPGDRVALFSPNRIEWAIADYAILTAGAINVPVYATVSAPQLEFVLNGSEASVVIAAAGAQLEKVEEVRPRLKHEIKVIVIDQLSWDELRSRGAALARQNPGAHRDRADQVRETDTASIIYTSGTTGIPKGVVLTHQNIVSNVLGSLAILPITPRDTCLSFLPLSHILERMAGHFTMFHAGASIAYADSMDTVPDNLLEVRPTVLISVPRLYEKMYGRVMETVEKSPPLRKRLFHWAMDVGGRWSRLRLGGRRVPFALALQHRLASILAFSKIRARLGGRIRFMVSGGAALGRELAIFFYGAELRIMEGYGLTETSPVIACNRLDAIRPGTVGQPIPGVEVRIADDGEILVRSPGVMKEYYKHPGETAAALAGGWFHTGDVGVLDPDGYLTITDRKKDLIVTAGGKKVAPQPLEIRLRQDPYIADVVLVGDRRPYVVALVVPERSLLEAWAAGQGIGTDDWAAVCRDERVKNFMTERVLQVNAGLAPFEQIKKVGLIDRPLTVDGGDLTPTLKLRRQGVTANFQEYINSLYAGHAPS